MSQLRREMGLRDVTLFAIACIIGTRWIPAAAHAGPGSVMLWLLTALLFVIPLAIAVAALIVKYPGAGGLYLWTRGDFGPWHGFLCFWVYWMGLAVWFPSATMFYMSVGLGTVGIVPGRATLLAVSIAAIWVALGTNLLGVKIGKWTENVGGASSWVLGGLLAVVAALVWARRGAATPMHFMPHWNWNTLNFWSTIAYGMSGLELAGLMGAEMHDPERTLPRAGWIASAFATLFYSGATIAMLVLLRPEKISELNGYAEVAQTAGSALGALWLAPLIAVLVLASGIGQIGGIGTAISRLPFAAGVDGLLPKAFARVHPRWGTPHYSILALGVVASFLLIAVQIGDTMRAAYQELVSLMVITGFLPYLYIFGSAWKAGKRVSPICGWAITILAILCSVVPTADIANVWLFESKLAVGTFAAIATAWLVYRRRAA
ncbi:MAG: APC family permease [Candidatus Sulfopaludibacter sp.]|nr:APC family permease [Candidatus Sulfopaludibacter sp.]